MRAVAAAIVAGAPAAPTLQQAIDELSGLGFTVEYLELRDAATLAPLAARPATPTRLLAAVHLGRTRLIDNIAVYPTGQRVT